MCRRLPLLARLSPWLAALAFAPAALAREPDGDIVVLGRALPPTSAAVIYGEQEIGRERLVNAASGGIEDVLRDIAGFSQFRRSDSRSANPSAQGANLRALGGNAVSRTLLLLDGVPMADPFFGYIPYGAIVPEQLGAVRVTRGGATGAFGAGAVAGLIEVHSAGRDQLPRMSAQGLYGSHDSQALSIALSPDVGAGFVSLSGHRERGDGFHTTPPDRRTGASVPAAHDSWNIALRAVAPLGEDMEIQARALVYRDDRTLRLRGAVSHMEGQDASIRLISRGAWQADMLAYVQARNFSSIVVSANSFRRVLDQRNTPALGLGGKVELRPPVGGGHQLRFGIDARRTGGDMAEDAYANTPANPRRETRQASGRQVDLGAFAEDDWTLGDVTLSAGGRIDRWRIADGWTRSLPVGGPAVLTAYPDRAGWEPSGRVGLRWTASPLFALRAAAYGGYRLPTLNELYRGFTVFPVETRANPALRPERSRGAEVGADLSPLPGLDLSVTAFDNELRHAIANVTIGPDLRERRNVEGIRARGIEASAQVRTGDFDLSAAWAWSDARMDAPGQPFDGLRPAQNPVHAGSATLAWSPADGPYAAATLRYTGRAWEDDLNRDALPAALTVDASASLPLSGGVELLARAENLFDRRVVTRNAGGGDIDLGAPRTLWIGLRLTR